MARTTLFRKVWIPMERQEPMEPQEPVEPQEPKKRKEAVEVDEQDDQGEVPLLPHRAADVVEDALSSPSGVLVEAFNMKLDRRDLRSLEPDGWVNDAVINFYFELIMEDSRSPAACLRVFAFSTFFYTKLRDSGGHHGVRRWTKKVNLFDYDLVIVPVHLGVHWTLAAVDLAGRRLSYYDSLGKANPECLAALASYIEEEHNAKLGEPLSTENFGLETLADSPRQVNSSDCGVHVMVTALMLARGKPNRFSASDMDNWRRRIMLEILEKNLLPQ